MNYSEEILKAFDDIRKQDNKITCFFIHEPKNNDVKNKKHFQEKMYFSDNTFIFSKFSLIKSFHQIHSVIITEDQENTEKIITKALDHLDLPITVTINLLSKEIFERNVFTQYPKAMKTITVFNKLTVIKGRDYISQIIEDAQEGYISKLDKDFQRELNTKASMLESFAEYKRNSIIIYSFQYEELFPYIYESITHSEKYGFPQNRRKLVFPRDMKLKEKVII
jgi:hypothetical protein